MRSTLCIAVNEVCSLISIWYFEVGLRMRYRRKNVHVRCISSPGEFLLIFHCNYALHR